MMDVQGGPPFAVRPVCSKKGIVPSVSEDDILISKLFLVRLSFCDALQNGLHRHLL